MAVNLEFQQLLLNLQHSDNEIRNKTESIYETIDAKLKLEYLLQIISDRHADFSVRIFSGVLCRRLLDTCYEDAYSALSLEQQLFTKQQLLSWILVEDDAIIRKKMCDVVVEIAKEQFDDDGNLLWQELFSFVFDVCLSSQRTDLKAVGLHFFASLPHMLGDNLLTHIDSLCSMFVRTMSTNDEGGLQQSLEVREASVKAFSSFIVSQMDEPGSFKPLIQIVPLLLQTTADCITAQPTNDTCMKALVELADSGADLLKHAVSDVLHLCTNILHNDDLDESQKHLAVEAFVSLSENCPAAVRKCHTHLQSLMKILFKMLTELEDDPNWATLDIEEEEDESSPCIVAEMALDRISCAMRGKKVLHEITHVVPAMLHSPRWQERHGGLMAISSCAEGLNKVMGEILGSIIDEIVPLLMDPHPRVRYAACNAVGQLSTDFGNKLQKTYHQKVLPALLAVLDDEAHPRVQAYAGAAMVNFCEAAPKSVVVHYLPQLAEKLLQVLQHKYEDLVETGRKLVLEQIVTTIAAVADSVADHFSPYYDQFMTFLKFLMEQCRTEALGLLRGKTIECISLMGLAVGRDRFLADAQDVMGLLLQSQARDIVGGVAGGEDPHHSYMISAWARMCKILGKSFAEFLPLVMKPVLSTAAIKPDVCMMYNDEAEAMDKDWQVVRIADDQNFAIHTSGLEDKATACQMLVCYARELSEAFSPYVLEVADIMIPLLKFYFNEEVRSSAADIMPHLIECSRPLGTDVTEGLWQRILTGLLAAIPQEPYKEQAADMLDSVGECIKKIGRGAMTSGETMTALVTLMKDQFQDLLKNQEDRLRKRRSEEYDEDDEERLEADKDEDDQVLCKLVDLMHCLWQVSGTEALGVFDDLLENIVRLQEPGRHWTDLQYALCFWDDMIEAVGPLSYAYKDHFLSSMLGAMEHEHGEIRQAAVYGVGLMAMYGGPDYCEVLRGVCGVLVALASSRGRGEGGCWHQGDEEEDDWDDDRGNMVAENAVSALAKIYVHRRESLISDPSQEEAFLRAWLSWLPVWEDEEETGHVYGLVCDLVESRHPVLLHDMAGVVHCVLAIVRCWLKSGMDRGSPSHRRCVSLIATIQDDQALWHTCLASMTSEEAEAMYEVVSGPRHT